MLEVLAIMLGKLAQRIGTPEARTAAIDMVLSTGKSRRRPPDTLYSHWNNLLDVLISDVYWASELDRPIPSGPAKGQPLRHAFMYPARLKVHREELEKRSDRVKPRSTRLRAAPK